MQPRTNRIALTLFAVYLILYGGFVFLNAYAPATMEVMPVAGVNLAILYGFGLIFAAFLLALLYGWLAMGPSSASTLDGRKHAITESNSASSVAPPGPRGLSEDQS